MVDAQTLREDKSSKQAKALQKNEVNQDLRHIKTLE